jgi:hypothetical protein
MYGETFAQHRHATPLYGVSLYGTTPEKQSAPLLCGATPGQNTTYAPCCAVMCYATCRCFQVLFTVVSREEKYSAKLVIDTVIQRLGDALAAAVFQVLGELLKLREHQSNTFKCTLHGPSCCADTESCRALMIRWRLQCAMCL